jgi:hypothetical protein
MKNFIALILKRASVFGALFVLMNSSVGLPTHSSAAESGREELLTEKSVVHLLKPDNRGGKAYKLVYLVDAPIDVYWNFKTDFDSDFLLTHKYIDEHRFIHRENNVVITEDVYSNVPNATFRWRTILYPSTYRLEFTLENPEACGQEFHYGYIQLRALDEQTMVTHVAYFDFLGVSLWVNYPWKGGMSAFLEYTAQWEQETILRLRNSYKPISRRHGQDAERQ